MKQCVRNIAEYICVLEFHYSNGGTPDFYTCRVYEKQKNFSDHAGRIIHNGLFWGDLAYINEETTKKQKRKSETDIYRLIDQTFPELLNKGLKSEGYAKYTVDEITKSGIVIGDDKQFRDSTVP